MFGGAKQTFGTGTPGTGFSGFSNTAAATPFGQSAFGKPATTAFGAAPAFGAQQATPSLFGQTAAPAQGTGLFGGATTSSAFGGTATTAPTTFGGFSQPQQQNTSIFGAAQAPATTSLFGQSGQSAFGSAVKPAALSGFGQQGTAQPTTSLFGQQATATSTPGFGGFGQSAATTTNVFGSGATSAFGQPTTGAVAGGANPGTSVAKYQATVGTDTLMKSGQPNNISTKQHCITAMKEYELKSLEELRMEDYLAGRKGMPGGGAAGGFFGSTASATQQPATGTGLFGNTTQPSTGLFGQTPAAGTENKSLFGQSAFGQPAATSAFGSNTQQFGAKPFGATTSTGFGAPTQDASNPFGAKPAFGQAPATGLFGQQTAVSTAPAFGQTQTGFGGFGTTAGAQPNSLFGAANAADANKTAFGLGTAASGANTNFGGFGTTSTSTASGGLFGAKPATGFGAAPAFGATSTANTGFGNFSLNSNTQPAGGLFNSTLNKPATSGFGGFGTQTSTAPLNFNAGNTGGSLFGNTAAKPGGLFGGTGTLGGGTNTTGGGGLFGGGTNAFGTNTSIGGGFGTLGGNTTLSGGLGSTPQQQQATIPIHQQILAKVTSPYGDTPIFKDLKRNDENDPTRATNPAAQKAMLDVSNNQFKVEPKASPSIIKVKPVGTGNRKSLFDGLEQFDPTVECFSLKPSAKRLIIKPKSNTNVQSQSSSVNISSSPAAPHGVDQSANSGESFNSVIPDMQTTETTTVPTSNAAPRDSDIGRRESWLHPNNLEKVRQHNLQAGIDNSSPLNSTLTELVPRKPLETYRTSSGTTRASVSTIPENPFEEQTSTLSRCDNISFNADGTNDSSLSNRSYGASVRQEQLLAIEDADAVYETHPTGITLKRVGYYTIPSLDELKSYLAEDGSCVVPNFTIGREGYGNVYFGKEMDVAGLNLDEIVHFRHKQIIIYPDDDNKPPLGQGLNRAAQVTLDQVWPHDKTQHEPIKDPHRLAEMDWEGKLRRICDKNDTRFVEYRPETGSWVFRTKHFSKYGLNDSDEEDVMPIDPKKAKMTETAAAGAMQATQPNGALGTAGQITMTSLRQAQKISEAAARALDPKSLAAGVGAGFFPMDDSAQFMLMDKTQFFQTNGNDMSMFDPPRVMTSPTSALAAEVVGNETHKMQLMKASLFLDDDGRSIASDMECFPETRRALLRVGNRKSRAQSLWKDIGISSETSSQYDFGPSSPPVPASSSASVLSMLREVESETSSPAPESVSTILPSQAAALAPLKIVIRPDVAPVKHMKYIVPLYKSLAKLWCEKWSNDLGLYKGHELRISFGPKNTLIVPTTQQNMTSTTNFRSLQDAVPHIFKLRDAYDFSPTILQHVQISATRHYEDFKDSIVPQLEIQLRNGQSNEVEGSECPWLQSDAGTNLINNHLDESVRNAHAGDVAEHAISVWSLMLALWGDHEQLEGQDPNQHFAVMCRRNLLSEWLENTLVERDLLTRQVSKHTYLDHLLDLLMCHRVNEACELAFSYDDANLALILAQLSSGPVVRKLVEEQMGAWCETKSDKYICVERLKMYMLAAGVPLMDSTHGPINILQDLNWIKVLALQLWYFTSPTASITDALLAYEKCFQPDELYAQSPQPCYVREAAYKCKQNIYDLRYHLLQLYSKRSHPLETLLNPNTHTIDPMDYRLSWLLLQTLEALGYHHISPLSECQLHSGFASQLENNGLWEWAVFVLLHIKDRNQRELAVQNLLYRYVTVSPNEELSEQERFVTHRLGVPEKWIDYAKAVKAGASRLYPLQAKYLLKAKQWALAHEVIFQHIAPDAVINGNLSYLYNLLNQFECSEERTNVKVPNWPNQGQIFLDFIDISEKFKQIKTVTNTADIEARWENLKPQLSDLCSRINLMPCPTAKHRLCQSEIAQSLSCLIRGILIVSPNQNPCIIIKIALQRLPLPQEFAKKELRMLLDTLVEDLTVKKVDTEPRSYLLPKDLELSL